MNDFQLEDTRTANLIESFGQRYFQFGLNAPQIKSGRKQSTYTPAGENSGQCITVINYLFYFQFHILIRK